MSFVSIDKGFHKLSRHPPPDIRQKELDRLRAITIYKKTKDVSLVCKTYCISRAVVKSHYLNDLRMVKHTVLKWEAGTGCSAVTPKC